MTSDLCEFSSETMPRIRHADNPLSLLGENSNKEPKNYFTFLPTEILDSIFLCLDGVTFIRCRRVCRRWKEIVDQINTAELWNEFYETEYGESSESTLRNSGQDTPRFQIYRQLYGWQHIRSAYRKCYYLKEGPSGQDILHITTDGLLATINTFCIQFFNLNTFLPDENRQTIKGNYLDFQENEYVSAVLCWNHDLHITKKIIYTPGSLTHMYTDVRGFFLDRKYIYYHVDREMVFRCRLDRASITECLGSVRGGIKQLNIYRGKLYVHTFAGEYWVYAQNTFTKMCPPHSYDSFLGILGTHNNDNTEEAVEHSMKLITTYIATDEPVSCTFTYNDMLILGTYCGQIIVYCFKRKLLLLRFQTLMINGCELGMKRAITRIQIHESPDGYSFITTTAIGNCITFYYVK